MKSPSVSCISRTLLSILFAASMIFTSSMVRAQEYTEEEYTAFQNLQAEKDFAKKTDLIVQFLREKPKSALKPNIVAEFQNVIVNLQNQKNWNQVIALGDKFLDVVPNDGLTVSAMAAAYGATNNTKGFAAFGEKAYASKPSGELALYIAKAYRTLGNEAKYIQWAEKALAADSDNVEILSDMMKSNMARQNMAQALKYAKLCLEALPNAKKPADMTDAAWKEIQNQAYAIAYGVIGANAYESKRYSEAIKNLDSAVKYYKRYEMAYYYLGMSYWQANKLDAAMLNFAKAYLIKGSTSAAAKKYLEQLYASSHRNSLAGIDRIYARAQQDLK